MHQGQDRQPTLKPTSAKAAFMHNHASVSTPQSLRFTIYVRSLESRARFARPFTSRGDNRTFTTRVSRLTTARIHLRMDVDISRSKITYSNAVSSETVQYNFPVAPFSYEKRATAHPFKEFGVRPGAKGQAPSYWFNVQAAEPIMSRIPVVGGITPNISLHGSFNLSCVNDILTVSGRVYGDGFPDAECFIVDEGGNAVMLATFKHGAMGSPLWDVPGDGALQMMDIATDINLNCNHNFLWAWTTGHHYNSKGTHDIPVFLPQTG